MRNPLNRRFIREVLGDLGKYLTIFIMMFLIVSECSGYLVANDSMIAAYNASFEKYNIENGYFSTEKKLNKAQKKNIESLGVKIYDDFYKDVEFNHGAIIRFYKLRNDVNLVCLMSGRLPEKKGEIAIDRMHCQNAGLNIGDRVSSNGIEYELVGTVALSDYSALFQDNGDSMFDSIKFAVSIVTDSDFEERDETLIYKYSWKYNTEPKDEIMEKEMGEDLMDGLIEQARLTSFVPRYQNQSINFAGEDLGADRNAMYILLYITVTIIAFVFAITISNTVSKEANVIGTLRASGYTINELIIHYMTLPLVVTLLAAILGNTFGYTYMKDVNAALYYGSYSLTTYETLFNLEALQKTTLIPIALMLIINFSILRRKLVYPPIKFLRRDIENKKQRKAFKLNYKIPFFNRFGLRVIWQNLSNYMMLMVGIVFANVLLMFGLMMPSTLEYYSANLANNLFAEKQYILQAPLSLQSSSGLESLMELMMFEKAVQTDNPDAEKFSAYYLKTNEDFAKEEEILFYGISKNSRYVNTSFKNDDVFVSSSFADKYDLKVGQTITLKENYGKKRYDFTITGIYPYDGNLSVFMDQKTMNQTFDLGDDFFAGYFSNSEINDIDEKYISTVMDLDSLNKISRQMDVSFGGFMGAVRVVSVAIFAVLIYILSKMVIEKNAQSISMAKILGYKNGEINRLYINPTSIVVLLSTILSLPLCYELIKVLWMKMMISRMSGWISYNWDVKTVCIKIVLYGLLGYALVALLEMYKISKIPKDEALKNVE